jgi:hypothetical protein
MCKELLVGRVCSLKIAQITQGLAGQILYQIFLSGIRGAFRRISRIFASSGPVYAHCAVVPRVHMEELKQFKESLETAEVCPLCPTSRFLFIVSKEEDTLQILGQLQDVKVTLELLKVTFRMIILWCANLSYNKGSQLGLVVGNLKKRFPDNKKIVDQSKKLVADWKAACIPAATPTKPQNGNKTPVKKEEEKKETKKEESPAVDKKRKLSSTYTHYHSAQYAVLVFVSI